MLASSGYCHVVITISIPANSMARRIEDIIGKQLEGATSQLGGNDLGLYGLLLWLGSTFKFLPSIALNNFRFLLWVTFIC